MIQYLFLNKAAIPLPIGTFSAFPSAPADTGFYPLLRSKKVDEKSGDRNHAQHTEGFGPSRGIVAEELHQGQCDQIDQQRSAGSQYVTENTEDRTLVGILSHQRVQGGVRDIDGCVDNGGSQIVGNEYIYQFGGVSHSGRNGEQQDTGERERNAHPQQPGPRFAEPGFGPVYDNAHDDVADAIEYTGNQHDRADSQCADSRIVRVVEHEEGGHGSVDDVAAKVAAAIGEALNEFPGSQRFFLVHISPNFLSSYFLRNTFLLK